MEYGPKGYPRYHGVIVLEGKKGRSGKRRGKYRYDRKKRSRRWTSLYLET